MRHLYQNFDINCSIFSGSVSGKKSGLNACFSYRPIYGKVSATLKPLLLAVHIMTRPRLNWIWTSILVTLNQRTINKIIN